MDNNEETTVEVVHFYNSTKYGVDVLEQMERKLFHLIRFSTMTLPSAFRYPRPSCYKWLSDL